MRSKKAAMLTTAVLVALILGVIVVLFGIGGTAEAQESVGSLIKVPGQQYDDLTSNIDFSLSDLLEFDFSRDTEGSFRESSITRSIDNIGDLSSIDLKDTTFSLEDNKDRLPSYTQATYDKIEEIPMGRGSGIEYLELSAKEEGISPLLVFLVATRESRGDPLAVSPTGAAGLTQFTSGTANSFSSIFQEITPCCTASQARDWECNKQGIQKCNAQNDDRFDPAKSLDASAKYLSGLTYTYDDLILVLTAYNAGPAVSNRCKGKNSQEETVDCVLRETEDIHSSKKEDELRGYLAEIAGDYASIVNSGTFS